MQNNEIRWIMIDPEIYGDKYKLSDNGNIVSIFENIEIIKTLEKCGTHSVILETKKYKNNKFFVEDLMAKYYLSENTIKDGVLVHIDGDLLNYHYTNLKYSDFSESESINYKTRFKLIFQFDLEYNFIRKWNSTTEINKSNPIHRIDNIWANLAGRNQSSYEFIWSYSRMEEKNKKIIDENYFLQKDNFIILDDKEYWKDIVGYESGYKISNYGNVYSKKFNKLITKQKQGNYHMATLYNEKNMKGDKFKISRLVAIHFIINSDNLPVVDHIDENTINDHYTNLRWFTHSNNSLEYHKNKKMPEINQYDKNNVLIKEWKDIREIIKENPNYIKPQIYKCLNNATKSAYEFIWKYKDTSINKKRKTEKDMILKSDEIFKNMGIYEDNDFSKYEISNYGTIRNIKLGYYFRPTIGDTVYPYINLRIQNGKRIHLYIHILVALCFCSGRSETKNTVNHIDENKSNYYYKNLEWTTASENVAHSLGIKVNQIDIETGEIIKTFASASAASEIVLIELKKNKICETILDVCRGKRKTAYGYKWKLADDDDFQLEKNKKILEIYTELDEQIKKEHMKLLYSMDLENYKLDKDKIRKKYNIILED